LKIKSEKLKIMNLKKAIIGFSSGLIVGSMLFYISRSLYEYRLFINKTKKSIVYWKSVAAENEDYPDAWVKLAINWSKLGKDEFARLAIKKASRMDPINDEIKDIKERLR
jgi:hypothetical protein